MPERGVEAVLQWDEFTVALPEKILVAVSGGSDSLALLHLLHDEVSRMDTQPHLSAATVDHGLRPAAASEAKFVAGICAQLGIRHTTLNWMRSGKASAETARDARYELLCAHAISINASIIALGHTQDDQAETLIMRARRMTATSGTRGLSGMTGFAAYEDVTLWRPLLAQSRETLRTSLEGRNVKWIDDPSNDNSKSERVRVRKALSRPDTFPPKGSIARLAQLSARHRHWLNEQTANFIDQYCMVDGDHIMLTFKPDVSDTVLSEVFAVLILVTGGQLYRLQADKYADLIKAIENGKSARKSVGRALISVKNGKARFVRETRNLPDLPSPASEIQQYDNRLLILPDGSSRPYITALERFRPAIDNPVYDAVRRLVYRDDST